MAPAPQPVDRIFRDLPAAARSRRPAGVQRHAVVKARLFGEKPTGGKLELLVERVLAGREVVAHMKVSKKPPVGTALRMHGGFTRDPARPLARRRRPAVPLHAQRRSPRADGAPRPRAAAALHRARRHGRRRAALPDRVRPEAGRGGRADGGAAFRRSAAGRSSTRAACSAPASRCTWAPAPSSRCKTENIAEHKMHSEWYEVPAATQQAIARTRERAAAASSRSAPPPCARSNPGPLSGQAERRHQHLHHARLPRSSTWTC